MIMKVNLYLLLLFSVLLFSCQQERYSYDSFGFSKKVDGFEVAKIDHHQERFSRIFIVTTLENAKDKEFMESVFRKLKRNLPSIDKVRVSVFSDKKYAHYKTELFMGGENEIEGLDLFDWYSNHYLGEYNYSTNVYDFKPMVN